MTSTNRPITGMANDTAHPTIVKNINTVKDIPLQIETAAMFERDDLTMDIFIFRIFECVYEIIRSMMLIGAMCLEVGCRARSGSSVHLDVALSQI